MEMTKSALSIFYNEKWKTQAAFDLICFVQFDALINQASGNDMCKNQDLCLSL